MLSYLSIGALAGPLFSLPASVATALVGHDLVAHWQAQPSAFRTIAEGVPLTFFAGASFFGAWAIVVNQYGWRLRRPPLVLASVLAGLVAAVIAFATTFLLDIGPLGPEIALSTGIAWFLAFAFGGLVFGFTVDIQMTRLTPGPFLLHLTKAGLTFGTGFAMWVMVIDAFKQYLFFPAYLERHDLLDVVGDAIRSALWGIGMTLFHWWVRWRTRV